MSVNIEVYLRVFFQDREKKKDVFQKIYYSFMIHIYIYTIYVLYIYYIYIYTIHIPYIHTIHIYIQYVYIYIVINGQK